MAKSLASERMGGGFLAPKIDTICLSPMPSPAATHVTEALAAELHATAEASRFGLTAPAFRAILQELAEKAMRTAGVASWNTNALQEFLKTLRVEELALARGCAAGNDYAWEVFLTRFREKLYTAARQITHEESSARDLADSVYGDLFASRVNGEVRVSKLSSYGGRGSLEGWLRTVLAQEWINRYRKGKRTVSLEEEVEHGVQFAAVAVEAVVAPAPSDKLSQATDAALGALTHEDRFVLASYFLDQRTLAEIARTLHVHESTISRRVEKLGKTVRKGILENLIKVGMSQRQAEEALQTDVRDLSIDLGRLRESRAPGLSPPPKVNPAKLQD
jgi:RNA polymerase sigma-70 factor (ECF subfamily)